MNKPYLLIASHLEDYSYPATGDWQGCFSSEQDALDALDNLELGIDYDRYEIVDLRQWTS